MDRQPEDRRSDDDDNDDDDDDDEGSDRTTLPVPAEPLKVKQTRWMKRRTGEFSASGGEEASLRRLLRNLRIMGNCRCSDGVRLVKSRQKKSRRG